VTVFALSIVTVHDPVPLHAPPQPTKNCPVAGIAVNVMVVPAAKVSLQSVPQVMPVPATMPLPVVETFNVYMFVVNVAVTDLAASIVTMHEPVPVHAPLQPVKVEPVAGVAVSVTDVPYGYDSLQSVPHEMPVPLIVPLPVFATVSMYVAGMNDAVTALSLFIVMVHAPVPEHAPSQPAK
jgi:hypothetical protein